MVTALAGRRRWWGMLVGALVMGATLAVGPSSPASAYTTIYYTGAGSSAASIGLIGDSSFAGVRWLKSYEPLKKFNFALDAESCRRTATPSCRGREGYAPLNSLDTLRRLRGKMGRVLVMITGYNDSGTSFGAGVDAIMTEAIAQRIDHVVWLTMRTAEVTYVSPGFRSNVNTFRDNNKILLQKAQRYAGRLHIADWATYSARQPTWVTADGVHLTVPGTRAVTGFIADQVTKVLAGQPITPPFAGLPTCRISIDLRWYDSINSVECLEQHLAARGFAITIDDYFDGKTNAAVNFINRARGWAQDGIADRDVLTAIGAYAPPPGNARFCMTPRLAVGTVSSDVPCLRSALVALGYVNSATATSYTFGLRQSVTHFQSRRGLAATGHANSMTMTALGIYRSSTCQISQQLSLDMFHADVLCLKDHLRGLGYSLYPSRYYRESAVIAVGAIERRAGLPVDGIADEAFLRLLGAWTEPPAVRLAADEPSVPETTTTTTTTTTAPTTADSTATTTTAAPAATSTSTTTTTTGAAATTTTSSTVTPAPATTLPPAATSTTTG